jgi:hypothetical protein
VAKKFASTHLGEEPKRFSHFVIAGQKARKRRLGVK